MAEAIAAATAAAAADRRKLPSPDKPGKKPVAKSAAPAWEEAAGEAEEAVGRARCTTCGAKLPADAATCPQCGAVARTGLKWFRRIGLILMLLLTVVAGWQWYPLLRAKARGKDGKPPKEGVEFLGHSWQKQTGTSLSFIRGGVTNHSDAPYFTVNVQFDLIDRSGAVVGKALDQKMVLDPRKVFSFSAAVLDPDAVGYTNATVSAQR